jgi:hypothetical protein
VWESERQLKQWLNEDGVTYSTSDIAPALVLLEAMGKIARAKVKMNAPRPGWIITAAPEAAERGLNVNGHAPTAATPEPTEDAPAADEEPDIAPTSKDATGALEEAPDAVARAILKAFDAGRSYQGNRYLCESETVLREWLAADGVIVDDATLSAALTKLETASLPGCAQRLIRGEDLHRRNRSRYSPQTQLPARAMRLEAVHPFDYTEYQPADIEPYLIPSGAGDTSQEDRPEGPTIRTI